MPRFIPNETSQQWNVAPVGAQPETSVFEFSPAASLQCQTPPCVGRGQFTHDDCIVTRPNNKRAQNLLRKLAGGDAKPGTLPGCKLDVNIAGNRKLLTNEAEKHR